MATANSAILIPLRQAYTTRILLKNPEVIPLEQRWQKEIYSPVRNGQHNESK